MQAEINSELSRNLYKFIKLKHCVGIRCLLGNKPNYIQARLVIRKLVIPYKFTDTNRIQKLHGHNGRKCILQLGSEMALQPRASIAF